jgi:large subunit ribosomal protein L10
MKAEKTLLIENLLNRVNASPFLFIVDYTGLKVKGWEDLRKRLRDSGAEIHVFKNTFVRKVSEKAGFPSEVSSFLSGQSAVVTGDQDVCAAAKVMKAFTKETDMAKVRGGVLDGAILSSSHINSLAELPSKSQLRAQLLGVLQAPVSKLVRLLNEPASSFVRVLQAKTEQKADL